MNEILLKKILRAINNRRDNVLGRLLVYRMSCREGVIELNSFQSGIMTALDVMQASEEFKIINKCYGDAETYLTDNADAVIAIAKKHLRSKPKEDDTRKLKEENEKLDEGDHINE